MNVWQMMQLILSHVLTPLSQAGWIRYMMSNLLWELGFKWDHLYCVIENQSMVSLPREWPGLGRSGRQSKHRLTSPDNAGWGHDKVPQGLCSNAPTGWCVSVTSYLLSQSHIVWKSDKGVILRAKQILDQHSYPETINTYSPKILIWFETSTPGRLFVTACYLCCNYLRTLL